MVGGKLRGGLFRKRTDEGEKSHGTKTTTRIMTRSRSVKTFIKTWEATPRGTEKAQIFEQGRGPY